MKIRVGDKVSLTREISYPSLDEYDQPITGLLAKGSEGAVAGVLEAGGDTMVLFQPEGIEQVYAVSYSAVKKTK